MGRAINQYMEDHENGFFSGSDLMICEKHIHDKDLIAFIQDSGDLGQECSFCNSLDFDDEEDEERVKVISWDDFMKRIMTAVSYFYDEPVNGLSYNSAEGGYLGNVYDSSELLNDVIGLDVDWDVLKEIDNTMAQDAWTEIDFYSLSQSEFLRYSWQNFSEIVKYRVRYFFAEVVSEVDSVSQKPMRILEDIGSFILELNCIHVIRVKDNVLIYRGRQHPEKDEIRNCKDIGPAPTEYAGANRFSAEGISIFYGAQDPKTAKNEILNVDKKGEEPFISMGTFRSVQDMRFIDLRAIPKIGFFNIGKIHLREPSIFLKKFLDSISMKLDKDGAERIEFIPSQVVTEYFRYVLPSILGKDIHGIIYKSTHDKKQNCYAIFADPSMCVDEEEEDDETILVLKKDSIVKTRI